MESCCKIEHKKERFYEGSKYQIISLFVSLAALILAFFWTEIIPKNSVFLYFNPGWVAIILCGIPLVTTAFENLFVLHKVKSALLISVALFACIALEILCWTGVSASEGHSHSYLFAAGEVAFLMLLGEMIEDFTVKRSRRGIEKLINLAPTMANLKMMDNFVSMPVSFVQIGDTVLVKPYEQISVDGVVIKGATAVNQSAITGESIPLDRTVGDTVYAGTWNTNGAIEISVTKLSTQTTVAKMVELVKNAEQNKAPVVRIADKWAGYIVPAAVILAILVFLVALFGFGLVWTEALVRCVTVLVVFCPCALALATPTAIAAAIGNSSYRGILVKSGSALESLSKIDVVVFDKTGTLTTGSVKVNEIFTEKDENEFLKYIASAEANSEHPLAKAIVDFASERKVAVVKASETKSLVGTGVSATVDGKKIIVAKIEYFGEDKAIEKWKDKGFTVVGMSVDGEFFGAAAISDTIREGAAATIGALGARGIKTVMLTGDNEFSAKRVAEEIGLDEYRASLLPEDKLKFISDLKAQGKRVCMVGDGVNDAPSLAAADCSITMGAIGSDVALEVADIALMNDRIEKLDGLFGLSKKTMSTIARNIIFAMAINLGATVLSAFGLLNPALGALVHNCTSVLVVLSSSTLLMYKKIDKSKETDGKKQN